MDVLSGDDKEPVLLYRASCTTRGKRITKLLEDEIMRDDAFWNQDAFKDEENNYNYDDNDFSEDVKGCLLILLPFTPLPLLDKSVSLLEMAMEPNLFAAALALIQLPCHQFYCKSHFGSGATILIPSHSTGAGRGNQNWSISHEGR